MARHLFTVVSALSLALLAATAAAWWDSWAGNVAVGFGREIVFDWRNGTPHWSVTSRGGVIVLSEFDGDGGVSGGQFPSLVLPGFAYEGFRGPNGSFLFYTTSHRALAALFAVVPGVWVWRWRRRRTGRRAAGFPVHGPDEPKHEPIS